MTHPFKILVSLVLLVIVFCLTGWFGVRDAIAFASEDES